MKNRIVQQIARIFPIIAVCTIVVPLIGCGGGSTGGMAPAPVSDTSTAARVVTTPTSTDGTTTVTDATTNPIATATEDGVNADRVAAGGEPLQHDATLATIAQAYAERMATEGFFSHTDPQGKTVFDRANAAGFGWSILGENLAKVKTAAGNEATFAVNGWMNSPTHHANIVKPEYTETAIGVAKTADGTTFLVQVFARRN